MSKVRFVSVLAAASILAAACWIAAGVFPLNAATQAVADGPGVTVDLGSAVLIHRTPLMYPDAARTGRVEGTVVIQATTDSSGNVTDARVVGGPDELRRGVLQSVLQWHFARNAGTQQVSVQFQTPADNGPRIEPVVIVNQAAAANVPLSAAAAEIKSLQEQQSALLNSRVRGEAAPDFDAQLKALSAKVQALQKIKGFVTFGIYEPAGRELLASLPVHVGDAPTTENMMALSAAAKKFDEHLIVGSSQITPEEVEIRIAAPGSEMQKIKVGGNVQQANLIKKVQPVYPPEAKAAGVQGTVLLSVTIGKDGSILTISVVSGDPMLVPVAIDAVKQWVYRPTLLNGNPVEVATEIQVNFTLSQ